jgi:tight adherence protein C
MAEWVGTLSQDAPLGQERVALLAAALTFTAVFCFVVGYANAVRRRQDIMRRLVLDRAMGVSAGTQPILFDENSPRLESLSFVSSLLADVERRAAEKETEASKIKRDLIRAGYFGSNSVAWYQGIRLCLLAAFAGLAGIFTSRYLPQLTFGTQVVLVAAAGVAGFVVPSRYVARRQKQVLEQCRSGFPDLLDLLVICAEAGLSPRAAVDRISRELAVTYPYLGANLYLSNLELRAGASLHEALFNLARRTKVEEVGLLASLLQQTEQLGTSVTDALRVFSEEMRDRRLVRAEERAHALPVKLVLPLGLFVFPVILVVILLPVVMRLKNFAY